MAEQQPGAMMTLESGLRDADKENASGSAATPPAPCLQTAGSGGGSRKRGPDDGQDAPSDTLAVLTGDGYCSGPPSKRWQQASPAASPWHSPPQHAPAANSSPAHAAAGPGAACLQPDAPEAETECTAVPAEAVKDGQQVAQVDAPSEGAHEAAVPAADAAQQAEEAAAEPAEEAVQSDGPAALKPAAAGLGAPTTTLPDWCDRPLMLELPEGGELEFFSYLPGHPLLGLACEGQAALLAKVLENGAEPDAKDSRGFTALHMACRHARMASVRCLLEAGAVQLKDGAGRTPSDLAAAEGHSDVVVMLRQHEEVQAALAQQRQQEQGQQAGK